MLYAGDSLKKLLERFTMLYAVGANHSIVSYHYERDPPSPRSILWVAYCSANLIQCTTPLVAIAFLAATHRHIHP